MMKVIGIDPAPSKKTVIYDGEQFIEISAIELKKEYLDKVKTDTLICWDAPLTGGMSENFEDGDSPFYQRRIEQLINKIMPKVEGISTLPYARCPHWAITQHCLGLPQIFQPETPQSNLPFQLITEQLTIEQKKSLKGKCVVEVHPALALWLWLKKANKAKSEFDSEFDWDYKKNKETFKILAKQLFDKFGQPKAITEPKDQTNEKYRIKVTVIKKNRVEAEEKPKTMTDDHLDAYIAWLLGTLWLEHENKVLLVGNKNTGAMLLPNVDDAITLQENLEKYK